MYSEERRMEAYMILSGCSQLLKSYWPNASNNAVFCNTLGVTYVIAAHTKKGAVPSDMHVKSSKQTLRITQS